MGPLATSLAALLAGASAVSGTVFSLQETYDVSNFFDKFDFFESQYNGNENDHDPNRGFVNYKNRKEAFDRELVKYGGNEVYIGVDHQNKWWSPDGRPSVRLESKKDYTKGLFIARFNHLPKRVCGVWPAFWMYSKVGTWPNGGEIDIYENWNLANHNQPTFHTGDVPDVGRCNILDSGITGEMVRPDCSHNPDNTGCNVADKKGPWADANGGIYAVEWTDKVIRVFTWSHDNAPSNIDSRHPDTATWGKPVLEARDGLCNLKRQFAPQKLVLNIDFCGVAAGNWDLWNNECGKVTGEQECYNYVRNNPEAFKDVYWKVKDIRYFEEGFKPDPTSSTTTTTKPTTSSTSTSTSTSTTTTTTSSTTSTTTSSTTSTTSSTPTSTSTSTSSTSTAPTSSSTSSTTTSSSSSAPASTSSSSSSSSSSVATSSSSSSSSSSAPVTTSSSSSSSSTSEPTSSSSSTSVTSASSSSSEAPTSATSATSTTSTGLTTSSTSPISTGSSATTDSTSLTSASTSSTSDTTSSSSPVSTDSTSTSATQSSSSSSSAVPTSSSSSIETSSSSSSSSSVIPTSTSTTSSSVDTTTTSSSAPIATETSSSSSSQPASTSSSSATPSGPESTSTSSPGTATSSSAPVSPGSTSSSTTISTAPGPATTDWTTSVVYTTTTYTITSCAPTVTNCPGKGHVVTETIPLYTTVCPVTPTPTVSASQPPETITTKVTKVYTITSCAPAVTNCPIGKVTTEVVTSTLCPGCDNGNKPANPTTSDTMSAPCHAGSCGDKAVKAISAEFSSTSITSTSIPILTSTPSVVTTTAAVNSTIAHVTSTGTLPIGTVSPGTQKPTGGAQPPATGFATPSKPMSKAVALVAGMMAAAMFL